MNRADNIIKLLLIDDSVEDAEQLISVLRNGGIAVRPARAANEAELEAALEQHAPDLILADLACRDLRLAQVRDAAERARRTLAGIREAAAEYRTEGVAADRPGPRSPRITWLVLLGVLCMQGLARTAAVASADPAQLPVILPIVATIIVLYLVPHFRFRLLLIALLTFPLAWPGSYLVPTWGLVDGMWGFFIGLALVRLRPPASLAVVAGVLCLHVVLWVTPPPVLPPVQIGSGLVSDLILGGLVYSMTRLGELVAVLERARHELAEEAVTKERVRIARDLHDVLGFSLSAVALRGELALRLLDRDPERAEAELASLRELVGRQGHRHARFPSQPTTRTRMVLVEPCTPSGAPNTMTMRSPGEA